MPRRVMPDSLRARFGRPHTALLPMRLVFGATFVFAGLDKLLDPEFLQLTGRNSVGTQMGGWVQVSPLSALVTLALPYAVPIGLAIALGEIAVGLGALLGLAYRLAALGGLLLSVLFLLTASWAVRPFYLGNDLPYAVGWATLLLAGHGGVLALDEVLTRRMAARRSSGSPPQPSLLAASAGRRAVLKAGLLGVLALSAAGLAIAVEAALGRHVGLTGGPASTPNPEPTAVAIGSPSVSPSSQGKLLARIPDVTVSQPVVFQDPYTSDPGVLLQLKDGRFVAYDAVCTHAGCTVAFEAATGYLVCPCHGAVFDPARDAKAIDGPTFQPLVAFPIVVDRAAGTIRLAAN